MAATKIKPSCSSNVVEWLLVAMFGWPNFHLFNNGLLGMLFSFFHRNETSRFSTTCFFNCF